MGHKAVSAQMAFYGLAQALILETDFYKNKQKFLENFKEEELLNKSHFKQLGRFISEELIKNSRAKIIESNRLKEKLKIRNLKKFLKMNTSKELKNCVKT